MNRKIVAKIAFALNQSPDELELVAVGGGDIHEAYRLTSKQGSYFLKTNNQSIPDDMFPKEASGLEELRKSNFKVPEIISVDKDHLLLEFVEQNNPNHEYWARFGRLLAQMHLLTQESFGWKDNNFIGSLSQSNAFHDNWAEFFILERLEPQLILATSNGFFGAKERTQFDLLFHRLENLFPKEKPSLLHGDLWSGNVLCSNHNVPCIFDPAVYYGYREMDLAMTQLFGGFHPDVYTAYQEIYPLEKDYAERVGLCNLYPLLVHVNLFGASYVGSVRQILKRFTA